MNVSVIQPNAKQSGHSTFYPFIDTSNFVEHLWNKCYYETTENVLTVETP